MNSLRGGSLRSRLWVAAGVVLLLLMTACGAVPAESAQEAEAETEVTDGEVDQTETDRRLTELERRLDAAEEQIAAMAGQISAGMAEDHASDAEAQDTASEDEGSSPAPITADTSVTIFGDGEISCPDHRATSEALPVGTVHFEAGAGEIRVTVQLTNAEPDWTYNNIELWNGDNCTMLGAAPSVLTTDSSGGGEVTFTVTGLSHGTYRVNVNISSPGDVPGDRRHREMGAAVFAELVVG